MIHLLGRSNIRRVAWDAYCDEHPEAWFWHRSGWLDYGVALGGEDQSFAIVENDQIIGICSLLRESTGYGFEGEPLPWPLATNPEAASRIIAGLSWKRSISDHVRFRSCPLATYIQPLKEREGVKIGWHSRLIDLTASEEILHASLRKSYKGLIHQAEDRYEFEIGSSFALYQAYRTLHESTVGQIAPRPARTYELQWEWLQAGFAFLVGARHLSQDWAAFAYIFQYKDGAYYGSGPSAGDNIMHAVVWKAILEAKRRGLRHCEIGWQGHARDEKERAIEFFKAGFPGDNIPVYVMEI